MDVDLLDYLVETVCIEESGQIAAALPFENACGQTRLRHADDHVFFRRHDWPGQDDPRSWPLGYHASDAFLEKRTEDHAIVIHTFDFGTGGRRFGKRDPGDGGQAILVHGEAAHIFLTEDPGAGLQWFIAPACWWSGGLDAYRSWLLATDDVETDAWTENVTRLTRTSAAETCPWRFSASFTRYIRSELDIPVRVVEDNGETRALTVTRDTIVSEHYGRGTIDRSDHIERFFLAKDFGMVRWERWENTSESLLSDATVSEMAAIMNRSQRCPPVASMQPEAHTWTMTDCRMWTNWVKTAPQDSPQYRWTEIPPLE